MSNTEKRLFNFGIFIFNIILFTVVFSTVIYVFGGSISKINICLGVIASIIFCFFTTKKSVKETVVISAFSVLILILLILLCSNTFDWTVDGNVYRKSMTGLLKLGWNPLYETFYSAAEPYEFLDGCTQTWYDAYPKATEIFAASVYSFTGNIESGKCFTLLAMFGAFALCASYFIRTGKLKKWQSVLCSLLCVFNPVNLAQCFTFYNDAFLGILLLICVAAMMNLTFFEHKKTCLIDYWLIFLTINLGLNSKFSALIFFAILCLAFFFYWIFEKCKKEGFKKSKKYIFEKFCVFAVSVLSALLFVGSTSYVTNTIRYHNPVYTMIGKGSTEIITSMAPKAIQDMSHVERFFVSLFSPTLNSMALEDVTLKTPFDFTSDNFFEAGLVDIRLSGWGVLFSGIFILSLLILGKVLYYRRKTNKKSIIVTAIFTVIFAILTVFVPGLFWARYFTLMFWIPVAAVVWLFIDINEGRSNGFACGALIVLMLLNIVPNLAYNSERFEEFEQIETDLNLLKMHSQKQNVVVGFREEAGAQYPGQFFNIIDHDIEYEYGEIDRNQSAKAVYWLRYCLTRNTSEPDTLSEYFSSGADNLIIFVAARDEASNALNDDTVLGMRELGLSFDLENKYRHSYLAVIDGGKVVYENIDENAQTYKYNFANTKATLKSAGYGAGDIATIKIGKTNYSCNMRGLNFVVYDKELNTVIDSFYIDTFTNNLICR